VLFRSVAMDQQSLAIIPQGFDAIITVGIIIASVIFNLISNRLQIWDVSRYDISTAAIIPSSSSLNEVEMQPFPPRSPRLKRSKLARLHRKLKNRRNKRRVIYPQWMRGEPDYSELKQLSTKDDRSRVVRLPVAISVFDEWPSSIDTMMPDSARSFVKKAMMESKADPEFEITLADVGGLAVGVDYEIDVIEKVELAIAVEWMKSSDYS